MRIIPSLQRRRRKRILLFLLLSLSLLGTGSYVFVMRGAARQAQAFFALLREGKAGDAYAAAAPAFREGTSEEEFQRFARDFPFASLEGARWTRRSLSFAPLSVTLRGQVTLGGVSVPSAVTLVSRSGAWMVNALQLNVTGEAEEEPPELPVEETVRLLVRATMAIFGRAIERNDLKPLRASFAEPYKLRLELEELEGAFSDLLTGEHPDLSRLGAMEPSFTVPPRLDEQKLLTVQGKYADVPLRFDLRYAYEKEEWKLAGIFVRVDRK